MADRTNYHKEYKRRPDVMERARKRRHTEKGKEKARQANARPENVKRRKAYEQTEQGKEAKAKSRKKLQLLRPERYSASWKVKNALRSGRLIRQSCEVCNVLKAEAHHDDYSKPLEVRWLCRDHHRQHHREQLSSTT